MVKKTIAKMLIFFSLIFICCCTVFIAKALATSFEGVTLQEGHVNEHANSDVTFRSFWDDRGRGFVVTHRVSEMSKTFTYVNDIVHNLLTTTICTSDNSTDDDTAYGWAWEGCSDKDACDVCWTSSTSQETGTNCVTSTNENLTFNVGGGSSSWTDDSPTSCVDYSFPTSSMTSNDSSSFTFSFTPYCRTGRLKGYLSIWATDSWISGSTSLTGYEFLINGFPPSIGEFDYRNCDANDCSFSSGRLFWKIPVDMTCGNINLQPTLEAAATYGSVEIASVKGDVVNYDCDIYSDPSCNCKEDVPFGSSVNMTTGNLHHEQKLFRMPYSPLLGDLILTFDNSRSGNGPFGQGWTHNYNISVHHNSDDSCTIFWGDGTAGNLFNNGDHYTPMHLPYPALKINEDSTYVLVDKDGTTYVFDQSGKIGYVTDKNSNTVSFSYDETGNLEMIRTSSGDVITISHDSSNMITNITDPYGNTYDFSYYNDLLTSISTMRAGLGTLAWYYTYDDSGKMTTKTDPRGNTITYAYDGNDRALSSQDPLGKQRTITYSPDNSGELSTIVFTEKDGSTSFYASNSDLSRVAVTGAENSTTTRIYDAVGNLISRTSALGNTTTYAYDSAGNMLTITDPYGKTTSYTYNQWGQVTSITDPLGNVTSYGYDNKGNMHKVTDPLGNVTTATYDYSGNVATVTDAKGKTIQYLYDLRGRLKSVTNPLGMTQYTYNRFDKISTVTDAKGHRTAYDYDSLGRPVMMSDASGKQEIYAYNLYDNLTAKTDRKRQTTTYTYDSLNRLTNVAFADGSSTAYTYDNLGRLTMINDSLSGVISYDYARVACGSCAEGSSYKVVKETTPRGSISYTYDLLGRRASMTVQGQPTVRYTYDADSRLTNVDTMIKGAATDFSMGYDAIGRRTSMTLPNGVETTYTFDNANRLLNLQYQDPAKNVIDSIGYTYDANGNSLSMDRTSVTYPNPIPASSITYSDSNQMLTFNAQNITYDANGNMTSFTNSCGTTTYTWDARNRLVAINGFKSDCSSLTASFKYDALGRRIEKTVNGRTIDYLYDGADIVQEVENGAVTVNYIRSLYIDQPFARIQSDGKVRYYQADALGSVIALTDETGAIKTQYAYDPFGSVTVSGEASDNPFQYTGRENDGTDLYYYRARYYSPELQRFISEDPIGLAGGDVNYFSYVRNNPVRYIDPHGLSWKDTAGHAGDVIGNIFDTSGDGGYYGAAIGGAVGGVFGGIPGAIVGGIVGGAVGGLFDPAGAGEPNYNEQVPPIPPSIHMPRPEPPNGPQPPTSPVGTQGCHPSK